MNQIMQGDVYLIKADKSNAKGLRGKKTPRLVLARGETTGHEHVLSGDVTVYELPKPQPIPGYKSARASTMVVVKGKAQFAHVVGETLTGEHGAEIEVGPGLYFVSTQYEYVPGEIRRMAD